MSADVITKADDPWTRYVMALDEITERLERITKALTDASVPYALVGGQAVALWVATKDPDAVRTTKDVDILLQRQDLPRARAAAATVGMDYFEVMNVGMFLDNANPHPRKGVHLVWAGEKVRPDCVLPAPTLDRRETLGINKPVVPLHELICMKLEANRLHDLVHLQDMIDVGLIGWEALAILPPELASRLEPLLKQSSRPRPPETS
jgi:hypothetical protein